MTAHRVGVVALTTLALVYAGVAGLRSVDDADLGWQLAAGRYLVERGQIPSQDVFTHTASGREWIYPPFSGAIFYLLYSWAGWKALSVFGALASVTVVALLLSGGGTPGARMLTPALAAFAVPLVAARTKVRSDLFSTILFATVLILLWRHYRGRRAPLWLLVPLMFAWANLHLGFVAGLALFGCYLTMEALDLLWPGRRPEAMARLRQATPWLAAGALATFLNPWGPRLYIALFRQNSILKSLEGYVGEWFPARISWQTAYSLVELRHPESGFSWLLLAGVMAIALAAWKKSPPSAVLVLFAMFGAMRYVRFQVLFAMIAVVVAGDLIGSALGERPHHMLRAVLVSLIAVLAGVRIGDLASNRYYLSAPENATFGPGVSWWYPERAAAFIVRERLPARVLNDYNSGGFLSFALWPHYPVSIDNRAVPFGSEVFFLHKKLLEGGPDAPEWQTAFDHWEINTLAVNVARYGGFNVLLRSFCRSPRWRAVYVDEVSAIFLRDRPENASWVDRLALDCAQVQFRAPATQNRAVLYNFYANAGWMLFALGRDADALDALARAHRLFTDDPQLALIRGSVLQSAGQIADAEREYRRSLKLRESDQAWYALGQAAAVQGRYVEAADALERAASAAYFPHEIYHMLGEIYLQTSEPRKAVAAFDAAERSSPYRRQSAEIGAPFQAKVDHGRARAWRHAGDLARAISFQERATKSQPNDAQGWLQLAEMYQAMGRTEQARDARARADALGSTPPPASQ